jgi:hypothetical protein
LWEWSLISAFSRFLSFAPNFYAAPDFTLRAGLYTLRQVLCLAPIAMSRARFLCFGCPSGVETTPMRQDFFPLARWRRTFS